MKVNEQCPKCGGDLKIYEISYYPPMYGTKCPKCDKITRAELRGSKLLNFCTKAKISEKELGSNDIKQFCYGLIDKQNDELLPQCQSCKANVIYADEHLGSDKQ